MILLFIKIITLEAGVILQYSGLQQGEIAEMAISSRSNTEIILPESLETRRVEFEDYLGKGIEIIDSFALQQGWEKHTRKSFIDRVMIFDDKKEFDRTLLQLAGVDPDLELPETYCAALEQRVLVLVTPEIYSRVFPEGLEEDSYSKLIAHEIAHRLHIIVLDGDEEAMGQVWFYEGLAIYIAGQFEKTELNLSRELMLEIMNNPERGDYRNYGYTFRYFAERNSLAELITKAGDENFNQWLTTYISD